MRFSRAILVLLALGSLGAGWGSSWSGIRATAASIRAVEAAFVQKKSMKILLRPLVSHGRFSFKAPGHMRWEYLRPIKSLLEMKGGQVARYVWQGGRYHPDARARMDAMQIVFAEITLWIRGRFLASKSFRPVLKAGAPTTIELTPKRQALARYIKRITLTLGTAPGTIQSVTILEAGDATTRLEFVRYKIVRR